MKVTRIEPLSKSRSKIYLDGEFAFVLYKGELRLYRVKEGEEIAAEDYHTILEELLPKRAKLRAMNLLKSRAYTACRLRQKLREGFYPESVIETTLTYVAGYHYIDDLQYAVDFITSYENTRTRKRIEQDLQNRGIDRETLRKAWSIWEEQGGVNNEREMMERLFAKKKFDPGTADAKERQRMYGFLMRRGFSGEQIRKAIREC